MEKDFEPIDLNRGVTIRKDKETGISVYMYKDTPGHYLSQFGKPLPESVAAKAGFPVEQHKKERLRTERRAFAATQIDKELDMANKSDPKELERHGDFVLVDAGAGRANIVDADGYKYNPQPLPIAIARNTVFALAGIDNRQPKTPDEVLKDRAVYDVKRRDSLGLPELHEKLDAYAEDADDGRDDGSLYYMGTRRRDGQGMYKPNTDMKTEEAKAMQAAGFAEDIVVPGKASINPVGFADVSANVSGKAIEADDKPAFKIDPNTNMPANTTEAKFKADEAKFAKAEAKAEKAEAKADAKANAETVEVFKAPDKPKVRPLA